MTRRWTVHLLHQTHLDVGYTHTQDEVFDLQGGHLERAMDLVEANRSRPDAARFRWNPEVTLPVVQWLAGASTEQRDRFVAMVREGSIGLDGMHANTLTGLCRPEELVHLFDQKRDLEELTGVTIDTAMITDVPGWNWGLVTAMADSGIRYLSAGPNLLDRIGYTRSDWGDRPFYWVSPSGRERVLLFVHGKGYSWFHTGLDYEKRRMRNKLRPGRVRRYLNALERSGYPYDTVILRYAIGADNGPPDEHLSGIVEDWNARIDDIQLVVSTTSRAMHAFEEAHGDVIPTRRGDLTPYWEDGAASTARETAIAREASERLVQAGTLAALTGAGADPGVVERAWSDVLLFSEHTWGAHNSIKAPDDPFAQRQWAWKRARALAADAGSRAALAAAAGGDLDLSQAYADRLVAMDPPGGRTTVDREPPEAHPGGPVTVHNTHSWPVSTVVTIRSGLEAAVDAQGRAIPTQRLDDGRLAMLVELPPLGARTYRVVASEEAGSPARPESPARAEAAALDNGLVRVQVDPRTGFLASVVHQGVELVDSSGADGFNGYVLTPYKVPLREHREDLAGGVRVEVVDSGPLRATLRVTRGAARTLRYVTEVSVEAGSPNVLISNWLERPVARRKEGIHFSFPFALPGARVRYDSAWGVAELDRDQLPGANRNVITATRWADVSAESRGACLVQLDSPLFRSGRLRHDPWRFGPPGLVGWVRTAGFDGTLWSYVMNNYWATNYKADQPGTTLFRYVLAPHGAFDPAHNHRVALEHAQPPIVARGRSGVRDVPQPTSPDVVIESLAARDGRLRVRLANVGARPARTDLALRGTRVGADRLRVTSAKQDVLAPSETVLIEVAPEEERSHD